MKKLLFWMVLIVGIVAMIGSCKKDDDSTTTTATASGCTVVSSCSSTATTDNVSGIAGNGYLTGTYDKFVGASATYTIDNTTGCVSDTGLVSRYGSALPTGTASFQMQFIMTSTTSYAQRDAYYSDTSCSTPIATYVKGNTNFRLVTTYQDFQLVVSLLQRQNLPTLNPAWIFTHIMMQVQHS